MKTKNISIGYARLGRSGIILGAGLAVLLLASPADAQQRRAVRDRPSEQTGSALLGRIGGSFTVQTSVSALRRSSVDGVATLDGAMTSTFGRQPRNARDMPLTTGLNVGTLVRAQNSRAGAFGIGAGSDAVLRQISGQQLATNFAATEGDLSLMNDLPPLVTPIYAQEQPASAFHRVFGVAPAGWSKKEVRPTESALTELGWSKRVVTLCEERVSETEKRALASFKQATATEVDDRIRSLAEASGMLRSAHRLHRERQLPLLLTVHLDLEREQVQVAAQSLYAVAERGPDVFRDRRKLAEQFGDFDESTGRSAFLDGQMQRYIRIAEANKNSVLAESIQAYCAWVLGQDRRARAALDRAVTYAAEREGAERVETFRSALLTALE